MFCMVISIFDRKKSLHNQDRKKDQNSSDPEDSDDPDDVSDRPVSIVCSDESDEKGDVNYEQSSV